MESSKETVVLAHGLWMTGMAMLYWKKQLQNAGFHVVVFLYSSLSNTLSDNAKRLSQLIESLASERIHLVGHSLGGLLILHSLNQLPSKKIQRIVLVGTPYAGSTVVSALIEKTWARFLLGKSIGEWVKKKVMFKQSMPVGVIAGSSSLGLGRLFCKLPTPHDGSVSVEETKMPLMSDHIVLKVTHTGMLASRAVVKQIEAFLNDGCFNHDEG